MQGRRVEVGWWGPATSEHPPIVLLHEGLGSVAMWRDMPAMIAECTGCRVLAYSRFGHGWSDPPPAEHGTQFMHDEARLLPEILDAAAIERAILLGHSDGGSIALLFAAEHPARAHALVLEAPHVFVEDLSTASIERMRAQYAEGDLRQRLARYHSDPDIAFRGWCGVWLDPAFRDWNLEAFLSRVSCPVLLIQGEQDQYGTLRQVESIARRVSGPVEPLVLAECGHAPHRDQREVVLDAISLFVARVTGP